MKINKKIIALATTIVLVGSATSAMAYGGHRGPGNFGGNYASCPGGGYGGMGHMGYMMDGNPNWTAEQRQEYSKMADDFYNSLEPKRQQLQAKHLELGALSNNPNTQPAELSKLANEIAALNSDMRKMGQDFRVKCRGKFGDLAPAPGMGAGNGHGGGRHHGGRW